MFLGVNENTSKINNKHRRPQQRKNQKIRKYKNSQIEILEMKYAIIKIRNSLDGLNRRMAITKKKSQRTWGEIDGNYPMQRTL